MKESMLRIALFEANAIIAKDREMLNLAKQEILDQRLLLEHAAELLNTIQIEFILPADLRKGVNQWLEDSGMVEK